MLEVIGRDIWKMQKLRTLDEIETEYFRERPEEIEEYISLLFEEYSKDGNAEALLISLRPVVHAQALTMSSNSSGLIQADLQKALSEKGIPKFESINTILQALGYRLATQKMVLSE
jgi:probable addiction module antidote protein